MRREICECDRCHADITKEPKYKVHVPGIFHSEDLDWEVCAHCCSDIRAFMTNGEDFKRFIAELVDTYYENRNKGDKE